MILTKHLGEESNGTQIFRNKITEIRVHLAKFLSFSGKSETENFKIPFRSIRQFPLGPTISDVSWLVTQKTREWDRTENAVPISI